jgi:hypothetical protein
MRSSACAYQRQFSVGLFVTALLISCSVNKSGDQTQSPTDSSAQRADTITDITFQEPAIEPAEPMPVDTFNYSDCPRGQAEPVIKTSVYPGVVFKLDDNNFSATEKIQFDNGDSLIIKHGGCEYYILTFRFETSRFSGDTTDVRFWMDKAALLMTEIEEGLDTPIEVPQGTKTVKAFINAGANYLLGQDIVYREGDVRCYATFDRIEKLEGKKFALEISYLNGPY